MAHRGRHASAELPETPCQTLASRRRALRGRHRRVGRLRRVREPGKNRKWAFATSAPERGARHVARETPLTRLARWGPPRGTYQGATGCPRVCGLREPRGGARRARGKMSSIITSIEDILNLS